MNNRSGKNDRQIGLFEDINDEIEKYEIIETNNSLIRKYYLVDGTVLEVPMPKKINLQDKLNFLGSKFVFSIPYDISGLEKLMANIVERMQALLYFKECVRLNEIAGLKDGDELNKLKQLYNSYEEYVKSIVSKIGAISPIWWGNVINGISYNGGNPNNMFGVDGKYNYLLNDEDRFIIAKRQLMYALTKCSINFNPSETFIAESDVNMFLASIEYKKQENLDSSKKI